MKTLNFLFVVPFLLASCIRVDQAPASPANATLPDDGAFIHVSKGSGDTHDVLMALMLADKFSTSHDVLLFFDKEGIEMVVKGAPDLNMEPFESSEEIFARMVSRNIEILACPACLEVAGYTRDDLREGVSIAEKERFFDFTKGRILTLDY
jgi:predicted peroxiredoxin